MLYEYSVVALRARQDDSEYVEYLVIKSTGLFFYRSRCVKNAFQEIDGNAYYFDNEEYKIVCII